MASSLRQDPDLTAQCSKTRSLGPVSQPTLFLIPDLGISHPRRDVALHILLPQLCYDSLLGSENGERDFSGTISY